MHPLNPTINRILLGAAVVIAAAAAFAAFGAVSWNALGLLCVAVALYFASHL